MLLRRSMCLKLVLPIVVLIILPTYAQFNKREGDSCEVEKGILGKCATVNNCERAKQNLIATGKTNLPRCGFKKIIEIVCCPTVTTRFAEKTKTACINYSKRLQFSVNEFIHGGTNADEGEFPHMAAIGFEDNGNVSFECGGTLISERFVVTAAHCTISNRGISPTVVRLGTINIRGTVDNEFGVDYVVESITNHPEYQPPRRYHDISLLRLNRNVEFSDKISPACLHISSVNETIRPLATGWGILNNTDDKQHSILQKVTLPLVDTTACNEAYIPQGEERRLPRGIDGTLMICAGTNNGTTDTCTGDSGGPLQIETENTTNWSIIGLTSFGVACGGSPVPGVYTKISNYIDWIERIVWP